MWAPVQRADRLPRKTKKAMTHEQRAAIALVRSERARVMRRAWERLFTLRGPGPGARFDAPAVLR